MNSSGAEARLRNRKPVAFIGQDVGHRDTYVTKRNLGMPMLILISKNREATFDGQSNGVARYKNHRLLTMWLSIRIGFTHDDKDFATSVGALAVVEDLDVVEHGVRGVRPRLSSLAVEQLANIKGAQRQRRDGMVPCS